MNSVIVLVARIALVLCVIGAVLNAVNTNWVMAAILAFVSIGLARVATGGIPGR